MVKKRDPVENQKALFEWCTTNKIIPGANCDSTSVGEMLEVTYFTIYLDRFKNKENHLNFIQELMKVIFFVYISRKTSVGPRQNCLKKDKIKPIQNPHILLHDHNNHGSEVGRRKDFRFVRENSVNSMQMTFDISWDLTFHNIWHFMTFDISWHLTFLLSTFHFCTLAFILSQFYISIF